MSKKYIQNTYTADIQINAKVDGRPKSFIFAHYQRDKISNQVISDGFTEIDEKDLKVLNNNGAFKLLVDKKKLVIKDTAPLKAGSFEQILQLKATIKEQDETIAALRAEIEELKAGKKPARGKGKANKSDEATEADPPSTDVEDTETDKPDSGAEATETDVPDTGDEATGAGD